MIKKKEPRIFVTTDTHGDYVGLLNCLVQAEFDYDIDTLIHLGDVVDRGRDSYKVVELLLSCKNLIAIKGNHDDWFLEWMEKGQHPAMWLHGGRTTIASYMEHAERDFNLQQRMGGYISTFNNTDVPDTHKAFFREQKLYHLDDQNRFFCHAGFDPLKKVEDQDAFEFYWDRQLFERACALKLMLGKDVPSFNDVNGFKRIFIGHTPTTQYVEEGVRITTPMYIGQLVNLDTGGYGGGKRSLIDISDDENHVLYQS